MLNNTRDTAHEQKIAWMGLNPETVGVWLICPAICVKQRVVAVNFQWIFQVATHNEFYTWCVDQFCKIRMPLGV